MRSRTWITFKTLWSLLVALQALALLAKEPAATAPAEKEKYVRIARGDDGELKALETAVVHFASDDPQKADVKVDLVGAIHVGDKDYYERLNKLFESYDVVLYELVAPEGTRVERDAKPGRHPIALVQTGLKDLLGLEHQLQCVDYTRPNFVHADMSPEGFSQSMEDRGESLTGMFFRMMGSGIAQQAKMKSKGKSPEMDLITALMSGDRAGAMKRMMAEQFDGMEEAMAALDGPQGSSIITERNRVALEKLKQQLAAGKKRIAIFYGAGHLGDMEKHLASDFHLHRTSLEWIPAWKLEPTKSAAR